ncbi:M1 family metallopeptidase [Archangium lansingense]|uniref:M1 family metallopeptidase n=1 Tax=Archangium lansingense TaxID=2995310 RepID=A0ABT4A154_9BACT|nr:M1 family metallopeptidase [Archangium lansinium]MCY1075378.1 M1 family metallopeptidase [Archangium lansinium]
MTRVLSLLLLLGQVPALAAESPAPPAFDKQGRTLGPPLSERVTDYEIDARLDPSTHALTGQETVTWRNRSAEPQATLWFHLYWNAFKNDRSTFYRDSKAMGGIRNEDANSPSYPERKKDEWGYSNVKALRVKGGADLLPTLRFEHPDDDNAEDQTVFTVTLPEPVPPGGQVTLELEWEARVPKVILRAGRTDSGFYLMGQWFPKLGVLEVPPEGGATSPRWNCHQYHAASEFYADFGTYDVRLTVPQAMKVGATGVLVDRRENPDGTQTLRYHQDDVHDFAWTASERFEVLEDVFRSPGLPEVGLTVLVDRNHLRSGPQLMASAKASIEHFGRWWSPWPYSHLTVVAPPTDGTPAGGMEYPTFITAVGRAEPGEPKDFIIWQTVAHEFGHNYWQGLLASNEFEEPWLDEGINSYGTYKLCLAEDVRANPADFLPSPLRGWVGPLFAQDWDERDRMRGMSGLRENSPIIQASWQYRSRGDYFRNAYSRPQLTLFALEQLVGEETMARIMRTYVERWKFRHPRGEDFFAVVNEVSGQDLGWFFDTFFRGTGALDYAVGPIECEERAGKKGLFDDGKGGVLLVEREPRDAAKDEPVKRCEVQVSRLGDIRIPVDVRVTFADGSSLVERWNGQERWKRLSFERTGKDAGLKQVELHGVNALDIQPANNSQTKDLSGHVAVSLFGWTTYVSQMLSTAASLFL